MFLSPGGATDNNVCHCATDRLPRPLRRSRNDVFALSLRGARRRHEAILTLRTDCRGRYGGLAMTFLRCLCEERSDKAILTLRTDCHGRCGGLAMTFLRCLCEEPAGDEAILTPRTDCHGLCGGLAMTFLRCLCEERSDEAISGHNASDGKIASLPATPSARSFGSPQ